MPRKLKKSLQKYLSKIKDKNTLSLNSIIPVCKHNPKTHSFAMERNGSQDNNVNNTAATLVDVERFLFENFRSLYLNDDHEENPAGYFPDSPRCIDPLPNIRGSNRFFVTTGGSSSLIEEAMSSCNEHAGVSSSSTSSNDDQRNMELPDNCIAVLKRSACPYNDFRVSMQEMMEAKVQQSGGVDWDYLEELLFCYLDLNDKCAYKYILSAFVDHAVGFRQRVPVRSRRVRWFRERR